MKWKKKKWTWRKHKNQRQRSEEKKSRSLKRQKSHHTYLEKELFLKFSWHYHFHSLKKVELLILLLKKKKKNEKNQHRPICSAFRSSCISICTNRSWFALLQIVYLRFSFFFSFKHDSLWNVLHLLFRFTENQLLPMNFYYFFFFCFCASNLVLCVKSIPVNISGKSRTQRA